eukprot:TRINITY_DN13606_c0_g1_i1.p1 TRINITY_DN13606_c0_g1~~TRINITY_DN13606_c0_g1_i1.p1  ORF type:complete len:1529 (+),score=360.51 TRINITY_DN13606_c0_g1_i1:44-4630(+)
MSDIDISVDANIGGSESQPSLPPTLPIKTARPVTPGGFPALADAARQQAELVCWVARTLQEHEEKLESLSKQIADELSVKASAPERPRWSPSSPSARRSLMVKRASTAGVIGSEIPQMDGRHPSSSSQAEMLSDAASNAVRRQQFGRSCSPAGSKHKSNQSSRSVSRSRKGSKEGSARKGSKAESTRSRARSSDTGPSESGLAQEGTVDASLESGKDAGLEPGLQSETSFEKSSSIKTEEKQEVAADAVSVTAESDTRRLSFGGASSQKSEDIASSNQDEDVEDDAGDERTHTADLKLQFEEFDLKLQELADYVQEQTQPMERSLQALEERLRPFFDGSAIEKIIKDQVNAHLEEIKKVQDETLHKIPEFERRLSSMESNQSEMKVIRLQLPDMRNDIDTIREALGDLDDRLEESNKKALTGSTAEAEAPPDSSQVSSSAGVGSTPLQSSPEDGPLAGAHSASASPTPSDSEPQRKVNKMATLGAYTRREQNQKDDDLSELRARVEKLERQSPMVSHQGSRGDDELSSKVSSLESKFDDFTLNSKLKVNRVESKLETMGLQVDTLCTEDMKAGKTWNLSHQVEVVQSLVKQEMKYCRNEIDQKILKHVQKLQKAAASAPPVPSSPMSTKGDESEPSSPTSPAASQRASLLPGNVAKESQVLVDDTSAALKAVQASIQDLEEKMKRLQDNSQQSNLRLAGLKSAHKHAENQAAMAIQISKKLEEEVVTLTEQAECQQIKTEKMESQIVTLEKSKSDLKRGDSFQDPTKLRIETGKRQVGLPASSLMSTTPDPLPKIDPALRRRKMSMQVGAFNLGRESPESITALRSQMSSPNNEMIPSTIREDVEMNTSRIARLGKKVSELDGEMSSDLAKLRDEFEVVSSTLEMFVEFLPRRQRTLLQKQILGDQQDDEDESELKKKDKPDSGKHVSIGSVEYRTFQLDDDMTKVPWQMVGELDAKWAWCMRPMNEMGRELANYFEQREHEFEEFEDRLLEKIKGGGGGFAGFSRAGSSFFNAAKALGADKERRASVEAANRGSISSPGSPTSGRQRSAGDHERMTAQIEEAILPQLTEIEGKIERMSHDLSKIQKVQDLDHVSKAEKEDVNLLHLRVTALEAFDTAEFKLRMETCEGNSNYTLQILENSTERLRKLESICAVRADTQKIKAEVADFKTNLQVLEGSYRDTAATQYHANRKFVVDLQEIQTTLEIAIDELRKQKVDLPEHQTIVTKVLKLESSMRDNRQILSESGGQELSAVVKRIILNMEDKIMLLEKKLDLIIQNRSLDESGGRSSPFQAPPSRISMNAASAASEAGIDVQSELMSINEAVQQLKTDVSLTKVDMDQISEQGVHNLELATRLNVMVENGLPDDAREGTMLSLNRVQVMIATAARQLVAGSKWVTKETFDGKLMDIRNEYLRETRTISAQIEDLSARMSKAVSGVPLQLASPTPSKLLPKMAGSMVKKNNPEEGLPIEWQRPSTTDKADPKPFQRVPPMVATMANSPIPKKPGTAPLTARGGRRGLTERSGGPQHL